MAIKRKIEQAIKLIKAIGRDGKVVEVAYSGGKDSDVVLSLTRMAGINYRAIHKDVTVACPHTLEHVRETGAEIMKPAMNFFEVLEQKGMPTRFRRFCCDVLKEYKIMDDCLYGIRQQESSRRAKRYVEPYDCRTVKGGLVHAVYPILYWSTQDELEYIKYTGLRLHPAYYVNGKLDLSKRVGCMGCPLKGDVGLQDFKNHPVLVKLWLKSLRRYMQTHPNNKYAELYGTEYAAFAKHVFFKSVEDYNAFVNKQQPGWKEYLSNYFRINL